MAHQFLKGVRTDPTLSNADNKQDVDKINTTGSGVIACQISEHSKDGDEALQAFLGHEGSHIEVDEATNSHKTTLSYASIMGLRQDINLVGDNYQWLGSMFYFGYLAWEYPTNRFLQRLPLGKYSAFNVFMWGATLTCFAAVNNFAGAVAVRFFLGVFEAAVTPGFALLTSQWYTKREQGFRTSIWFSFNGWAQIIGGLLAYGIAVGVRKHGADIAGWQIIFMVTGLLTSAIGVLFYFIVPDNQLNARWLTKEERILAIERIRSNEQGVGNKHWKFYQFKEALVDPKTWLFFFYSLMSDIPNGGLTNFFSQLIVSFGYTQEESLLYGTPGGAVEVVTLLLWGWLTVHYGNRLAFSSIFLLLAILGMILIVALPLDNKKGRLAGYYLTQASPVPFVAILSLISTNVAGYTKKTTVAALYLIAYCVGNIIGPQVFRPKDAPRYVPAEIVIIVSWGTCLVTLACIYSYSKIQNSRKLKLRNSPGYVKLENQGFLDLTDGENPEFEYAL
ncbi:hypothetical protein FH972_023146 [Carpinus fangiana]|uniref:Major facilitator superfamily (MFS) profile domain-containing protein n=1 Tax=Carpinus fangiana TaxID=176857 RepID=A0A5N6KUY3_9ROSI|nr:hypothetical protein FH972_023146 [Carpinus fangiana]